MHESAATLGLRPGREEVRGWVARPQAVIAEYTQIGEEIETGRGSVQDVINHPRTPSQIRRGPRHEAAGPPQSAT